MTVRQWAVLRRRPFAYITDNVQAIGQRFLHFEKVSAAQEYKPSCDSEFQSRGWNAGASTYPRFAGVEGDLVTCLFSTTANCTRLVLS